MTEHFTIREAIPDDAAELINYLQEVGVETRNLTLGAEGISLTEEEERRFLEAMQASERSKIYLAFSPESDIVGNPSLQAYSRERMQHRANIAISVKKKYWGWGIATALMQQMIDFSRSIGVELITLEVLSENRRAISLYEKLGFEKFGSLEHFYKLGGEYCSGDYMKLKL